MDKGTQGSVEQLRLALHGVDAPFSCEGTFAPRIPVTITFKDGTQLEVTRAKNSFEQKDQLKPLLQHCKPAPFGAGKQTRHDRRVEIPPFGRGLRAGDGVSKRTTAKPARKHK